MWHKIFLLHLFGAFVFLVLALMCRQNPVNALARINLELLVKIIIVLCFLSERNNTENIRYSKLNFFLIEIVISNSLTTIFFGR